MAKVLSVRIEVFLLVLEYVSSYNSLVLSAGTMHTS